MAPLKNQKGNLTTNTHTNTVPGPRRKAPALLNGMTMLAAEPANPSFRTKQTSLGCPMEIDRRGWKTRVFLKRAQTSVSMIDGKGQMVAVLLIGGDLLDSCFCGKNEDPCMTVLRGSSIPQTSVQLVFPLLSCRRQCKAHSLHNFSLSLSLSLHTHIKHIIHTKLHKFVATIGLAHAKTWTNDHSSHI